MGRCGLCERQMLGSEGCVEHKVLLGDATVIDAPRHGKDSLVETNETCHDCAAEQGEYHHPWCDSARTPDGTQILGNALEYWVPDEDPDPRGPESDLAFIVRMLPTEEWEDEPKNMAWFDTLGGAEGWIEQEDWAEFDIDVLRKGGDD